MHKRGGISRKGLTAQWLQQFASSTEVSTFLQYTQFPLDGIFFTLPYVVSCLWVQLAPLSVAPFMGPDDALLPLRWMSMSAHLHRSRTTQGSLADCFSTFVTICIRFDPFQPSRLELDRTFPEAGRL